MTALPAGTRCECPADLLGIGARLRVIRAKIEQLSLDALVEDWPEMRQSLGELSDETTARMALAEEGGPDGARDGATVGGRMTRKGTNPDGSWTVASRKRHARIALNSYRAATRTEGNDSRDDATDLMADLLHLMGRHAGRCHNLALVHYLEERGES